MAYRGRRGTVLTAESSEATHARGFCLRHLAQTHAVDEDCDSQSTTGLNCLDHVPLLERFCLRIILISDTSLE